MAILGLILGNFGSFRAKFDPKLKFVANWSCGHLKRPQEEQNSNKDGFGSHFEDVEVILRNFGVILWSVWGHLGGHLGPISGPGIQFIAN